MFKISYRPSDGKHYKINCSAETIQLRSIQNLKKLALSYLQQKWCINTVEGLMFLTLEDIESIPERFGRNQVKEFWLALTERRYLTFRDYEALKQLRESNQRYNGEQKRAWLGFSLVLPFIKPHLVETVVKSMPGYESFSKQKKKIIMAHAA